MLNSLRKGYRVLMLQTQVLSTRQVNEPCIRLTQENSIESLIACADYS